MYDLVVRGGTIVDGTGAAPFVADVAIQDGKIAVVGSVAEKGRQEIDARGKIVTPGFVDIHTHYDGQATWDPMLTPSSWHGVTTVVFGNCGVGFAPVRPGAAPYLINLMEGVEDIPGTVLAEGVRFDWESFPQYLDALEAVPKIMDVGAQVPHAALRFYVMGDRGADHAAAPSDEEIAHMGELLEEARPVDRQHPELAGWGTQGALERLDAPGRADLADAPARGLLLEVASGRLADLAPGAPVDAEGRPAERAAIMGQPVQEGVGGRVVALSRRAE